MMKQSGGRDGSKGNAGKSEVQVIARRKEGETVPIIGLCVADKVLSEKTERIIELLLVGIERNNESADAQDRQAFEIQNPPDLKVASFLVLSEDTAQKCIFVSRYRYPEVKLQFEDYIRRLDFLDG